MNIDYDAIQEKVEEIKRTIFDCLEFIKTEATADDPSVGREIAEKGINPALATVNAITSELQRMTTAHAITKNTAQPLFKKIEKELGNLKNKIIGDIQKLQSNTVIKILKTVLEGYHKALKLVNETYLLFDT